MTVSGDTIELFSEYTVADEGGDMTEAEFSAYAALTADEVDRRVPANISSEVKDMLHALLILDVFEVKKQKYEMQSEHIGDYSYTRAPGATSSYRVMFEGMLQGLGGDVQASAGVERTDTGGFPLDRNSIGGMI
jgi:hypothetical protein